MPATRKAPLFADLRKTGKKKPKKKVAMEDLKEAVKDEVKTAMARETENKYACIHTLGDHSTFDPQTTGGNVAAGYVKTSILTNADLYKILPAIATGTDTFQREGTIIRPKSLKVQLQLALNHIGSSMDVQVRYIFFTLKQVKSYNALDTSSTNFAKNLFWNGVSGLPVACRGGEPYWLNIPINNRQVSTIVDKTITLTKGTGLSRQSNVADGTQSFVDMHRGTYEDTITIPCPASFKYDANLFGDLPTNFAPFFVVMVTQMDGYMSEYNGTGTDYNTNLIVMNYKSSLSYEDA